MSLLDGVGQGEGEECWLNGQYTFILGRETNFFSDVIHEQLRGKEVGWMGSVWLGQNSGC